MWWSERGHNESPVESGDTRMSREASWPSLFQIFFGSVSVQTREDGVHYGKGGRPSAAAEEWLL